MCFRILLLSLIWFTCIHCNDLYLGYPDATSKLIYSKVHEEYPAIWVRSDTFTVNCSRNEVISAIQVLDMRPDKWGEVYIKGGGIGERFVTIELDAPGVFRGFNFWVNVYAIQTSYFLTNHGK